MTDEPQESMLTAEHVEDAFRACLFKDDEDTADHVEVEGIVSTTWFHPERLGAHRDEVAAMLTELPEEFRDGGWSFLQACQDRHGVQWTGLHQTMGHLFDMGVGLGLVRLLAPRAFWPALPGGMPYYKVIVTT